jgi:uncharacterized protein (DUF1330 family)
VRIPRAKTVAAAARSCRHFKCRSHVYPRRVKGTAEVPEGLPREQTAEARCPAGSSPTTRPTREFYISGFASHSSIPIPHLASRRYSSAFFESTFGAALVKSWLAGAVFLEPGRRGTILTGSDTSTRYPLRGAPLPVPRQRKRQMVSFSPVAFDAFLTGDDDSAVVMLNLLRFEPDGGRERYLEYLQLAKPILARFGAQILFGGDGLPVLTTGQAQGWDAVVLVRYPCRSAFKNMVDDPEYQNAFKIGKAAIADIVLQPLTWINSLM